MTKLKTFSERLNASLDKLGFPPKHSGRIQQLAEMVSLSHRGAGKWVNGQSEPPSGKFSTLAKQLQVNEHWLRTGEGAMSDNSQPLLSSEPFGITLEVPIYPIHQLLQTSKQAAYAMTCILPYVGDFYGLVVTSEAMSPRFPVGSILILDGQATPKDGDFVLAVESTYPEPVFRQLLIANDAFYLHAHNPKFERLTLPAHSQVLGKLVQAIISFENELTR